MPRINPGLKAQAYPWNSKYALHEIEDFADRLLEWMEVEDHVFLGEFYTYYGLTGKDAPKFARRSERFRQAINLAKDIQEMKIAMGGLTRKYDASMCRFVLMNHHGYVNKTESKLSGDTQNPLACILTEIDGKTKELVEEEDESKSVTD